MIVVEEKDQEVNYLNSYVYYENVFCLLRQTWLCMQIGFTALSLGPNTSDSSAKQKWMEVMKKENAKMVCYLFCDVIVVFGDPVMCLDKFCIGFRMMHWSLDKSALGLQAAGRPILLPTLCARCLHACLGLLVLLSASHVCLACII
jgi:hypothetical protein